MRHPDPRQRQKIAYLLALSTAASSPMPEMREGIEEAVGALHHLLAAEDDPRVLTAATISIARMGRAEMMPAAAERLMEMESKPAREALALTYGVFGAYDQRDALQDLAQDEDIVVREAAQWSLDRLPSPEVAQEQLIDSFRHFLDSVDAADFSRWSHYNEKGDDEDDREDEDENEYGDDDLLGA